MFNHFKSHNFNSQKYIEKEEPCGDMKAKYKKENLLSNYFKNSTK